MWFVPCWKYGITRWLCSHLYFVTFWFLHGLESRSCNSSTEKNTYSSAVRWSSLPAEQQQSQYNGKGATMHRDIGDPPELMNVKEEITKLLSRLQELVSILMLHNSLPWFMISSCISVQYIVSMWATTKVYTLHVQVVNIFIVTHCILPSIKNISEKIIN